MKLVGLMPVRNEDWVLGLSLRAALMWCDSVILLDHASTDGTRQIIQDVAAEVGNERIGWMSEKNAMWEEMTHRQLLLTTARSAGATHIAIVDADEVLTGNLLAGIGITHATIHGISTDVSVGSILHLPGYNLRGSIHRYHSSGIWGNRWFSTAFRDDARLSWNGDRFHLREPQGMPLTPYKPIAQHQGGVMHLWGASERRLRAKSALYKLTERLRWPDKPVQEIDTMYSWAIHGRPQCNDTPALWQFRDTPNEWWEPYAHLMHHLHLDTEPWQETECRRLLKEYDGIGKGLDLFGVV